MHHELRALPSPISSTNAPPTSDGTTSDLIYLTERHHHYRLLLCKLSKDSSPSSHTLLWTTPSESDILPALIYLHISFWDLSLEAPLLDMCLARLTSALFRGDENDGGVIIIASRVGRHQT
ncbi:hypothetical protein EPUS_05159 [Endocarpon pusillum Z07020]|uniref:Uncharacterized protein n=1 Tax=Endocarpon pusillum (strain Z07020 / HMAS-L-300199) TaxID=1263415 RepID=U1GSH7_ENDPU|nr:uncharacterized protein EPUS_05159 [Endocarpon pusillum Z07020]ERF74951.1 hypothetical protein EPUS_05159 [Endocarpon pusillum Z07020]